MTNPYLIHDLSYISRDFSTGGLASFFEENDSLREIASKLAQELSDKHTMEYPEDLRRLNQEIINGIAWLTEHQKIELRKIAALKRCEATLRSLSLRSFSSASNF